MTMVQEQPQSALIASHVKAARALLDWSQKDLAGKAGVAVSTVADFERGRRTPIASKAQAIREALEKAGITFLPTGAILGTLEPSASRPDRTTLPIGWITAGDLSEWANRADAAHTLPRILSLLIHATHGHEVRLRFPADAGVRHSGWDGVTETAFESTYVPSGTTGWELGSQRNRIEDKASKDYQKRTESPGHITPASSTYVFVTPRHWSGKDEWAKSRTESGPWKDVRAYDADDLVHWIALAPAAALTLARLIGKHPEGMRTPEDVWNEWSHATRWPLTEALVLSDRGDDSDALLSWLQGEPSILSLQASAADEALAFAHATLGTLPAEDQNHYRARMLVAGTAAGARALADAPTPLIVLLSEPEPGIAGRLVRGGHHVLQAHGDRPLPLGEVRRLSRPSRAGIANALIAAGISEARASALARESGRNLAVLRRLITAAPGQTPSWASESPPQTLLAALLAGGWDEDSEADKARMSELADQPYDSIAMALAPYAGELDKPLRKVGSTWRMASPQDAWMLLAPYLTDTHIRRFEAAARAVLGASDPRFEMDPDERWAAAIHGVHPEYSEQMRHGVGEVLILLALHGSQAHLVRDASRCVEAIVGSLLGDADRQRWWSLAGVFGLLAEASPGAFLTAVEASLDDPDPSIRALFGPDGNDPFFSSERLPDLLWALETLAWSPDLMPRVSHVLARLDAIDDPPGTSGNRPAGSLRKVHLLWKPQTFATLEQRLRALDMLRKQAPETAWKLMLKILPSGHDSLIPSTPPRWRDFTVDSVEPLTHGLVRKGAAEISSRLLADVALDGTRWLQLLERIGDLVPDHTQALAALQEAETRIEDKNHRLALWAKLRRILHDHRSHRDATWSLRPDILDQLELIHDRLAPDDPLERIAWLFDHAATPPDPPQGGWKAERRDLDAARTRAATDVYSSQGAEGIRALAARSATPGLIGQALYAGGLAADALRALIETTLRSNSTHDQNLAHSLIASASNDLGQAWGIALIAHAERSGWGQPALLAILGALPHERWVWSEATRLGDDIDAAYWRQVDVFWIEGDMDDVTFAIRRFIEAGRARHAVALAEQRGNLHLPVELLIELLKSAASQPTSEDDERDGHGATMFRHYVARIFQALEKNEETPQAELVALEWTYLPVLERSEHPPKALLKALAEEPELFIQMLRAVYKADDSDEEPPEPPPEDTDRAHARARRANDLLELWDHLPGTKADGRIDTQALELWIRQARSLAAEARRAEAADHRIGRMLSASPRGEDGHWPHEAVRHVLDLFNSKGMIDSFVTGTFNRRGVTTRKAGAGGDLERQEAEKYSAWARAISIEHPRTANALNELVEIYQRHATRVDEDAERFDL